MVANLKLALLLIICAYGPYSIRRKREADAAGNPMLRPWGWCALSAASGVFCAWKGFEALLNASCESCPDDPTGVLGLAAFCFLSCACFYSCKITLFKSYIEYKRLRFWESVYSLDEMTSITEGRGGISFFVNFSGGRKLAVWSTYSGRLFFLEQLNALNRAEDRKGGH